MSVEKISEIGGFARFKNDAKGYTVCANESIKLIENLELRGLYISLLMLPDDWKIHKSQIRGEFGIGQNKLDKYFTELKNLGLLTIVQGRDENGFFTITDYHIHMLPLDVSTGTMESVGTVTVGTDMSNYKVKDNTKQKKDKIADSAKATPATSENVESLELYRWKEWQKIYPDCNVRNRCLPKLKKLSKQEFIDLLEGSKWYVKKLEEERKDFKSKRPVHATTYLNNRMWETSKEEYDKLINEQERSSYDFRICEI